MTTTTVSLVAQNQRIDLERLLPTLLQAAELAEAEILLVDNRSADGTYAYVQNCLPIIKVTHNGSNSGYGANRNINLRLSRGFLRGSSRGNQRADGGEMPPVDLASERQ